MTLRNAVSPPAAPRRRRIDAVGQRDLALMEDVHGVRVEPAGAYRSRRKIRGIDDVPMRSGIDQRLVFDGGVVIDASRRRQPLAPAAAASRCT